MTTGTPAPQATTVAEASAPIANQVTSTDLLRLADVYAQAFTPTAASTDTGKGQYVVYTPPTDTGSASSSGGVNSNAVIGVLVLAVVGYFLYKKFHKGGE